jgi:uncharacterized protein (TIGR02147 family)
MTRQPEKPNLFDFIDYRLWLRDVFAFLKKTSSGFSHRKLAARLSLSSPSFMSEVLKGKKNLSRKLLFRLCKFLNFSEREAQYFELLVLFNQAREMEEKNHFFGQMAKFRRSRAKVIHEEQYKFYTKWYYSAVWNFFGVNSKMSNPAAIAREIYPSITATQVRESITLLLKLELLKKTANGYTVTQNHIVTDNPFKGMAAIPFNQSLLDLGMHALSSVPGKSRQYNVLMFSISENGFKTIKERIRGFQEELREIIERDSGEDRIYTLATQLFPNSRNH